MSKPRLTEFGSFLVCRRLTKRATLHRILPVSPDRCVRTFLTTELRGLTH